MEYVEMYGRTEVKGTGLGLQRGITVGQTKWISGPARLRGSTTIAESTRVKKKKNFFFFGHLQLLAFHELLISHSPAPSSRATAKP